MDVEDENAVTISHKQSLIDIVNRETSFSATRTVGTISYRLSSATDHTSMTDYMICCMTDMLAILV
jgi:hypothetical protein